LGINGYLKKKRRKESYSWPLGVKENNDYIMSTYLTSQALFSNVQGGLWAQSVKILEF
jgi:hypothetical protein